MSSGNSEIAVAHAESGETTAANLPDEHDSIVIRCGEELRARHFDRLHAAQVGHNRPHVGGDLGLFVAWKSF